MSHPGAGMSPFLEFYCSHLPTAVVTPGEGGGEGRHRLLGGHCDSGTASPSDVTSHCVGTVLCLGDKAPKTEKKTIRMPPLNRPPPPHTHTLYNASGGPHCWRRATSCGLRESNFSKLRLVIRSAGSLPSASEITQTVRASCSFPWPDWRLAKADGRTARN